MSQATIISGPRKSRKKAKSPARQTAFRLPWSRVSSKDLIDFTRSFAVMIQARLSLMQALDTAIKQSKEGPLKAVLTEVQREVQQGKSFSESLATHPRVFSSLYVHLTRIGEVAGVLDEVLLRLATHLEKTAALKRKIQFALFYPGLILTVATGAVLFFLTTIVPTFAEMYTDFGQQLPGPTQIVLHLSNLLTGYYWLGGLLIGGLVAGMGAVLRTANGRLLVDRCKIGFPLLGTLLLKSLTAHFCRTLGTLLSSGIALVDAFAILAAASGNRYVEQQLAAVLGQVERGSSLAAPLQKTDLFPDMVTQLIAVGEETAELPDVLLYAASHYEEEVDAWLDGLTAIIEPVMIVVIGLVLGGILVALYLPMFELINTVG